MTDFVVPCNPAWNDAFSIEAQSIKAALAGYPIKLHHIGSTAIAGILAKPIIDLMGIVDDLDQIDRHTASFEVLGYEVMGAFGIDGRRYFRKFNGAGQRTHHLHVFKRGSPHIDRHLAFRDYLRTFPEKAAAYSVLKAELTAGGEPSWDAYSDGKEAFVSATEADALIWYKSTKAAFETTGPAR